MRFRDLAGLFEYVSLRCVKHRKVGFAGGNVWQGEGRNLPGVGKPGAGLGEIIGGPACIETTPSLRNSCMKPVRSR